MSFRTITNDYIALTNSILPRRTRYDRRNPGASPHDIKTVKYFIKGVIRGYSTGKKEPSIYTIL